ncbi:bHLH transcription factor Myc [Lycorma delicatula]|uniref:bHLH transcription factor Myc n=1 Tax=Lycorma delicatula TaxID=130591 RepID=UPI003F50F76A
MPIQFYNLDIFECWGEDDSSFINDLEFYSSSSSSSSPVIQDTIMMGGTSALFIPGTNCWKKFDNYDDEFFISMSSQNPLLLDELTIDDEWEADELIVSPSYSVSDDYDRNGVINHDCMWAGHCFDSEHESRTFSRQSFNSTFSSESANTNNYVISSNISSSSSSSSSSNNNNNNNNNNRTGPTIHQPQSNSNNNNNCSNNNNNPNNCSVVQTIEVPSICGPIRRTGVIVQKTVGRSLLIKSRTKSENNLINNSCNNNSVCNNNSSAYNSNNNGLVNMKTSNTINNNYVNNSCSVPTPPVTHSRPETPQSLPESEDDSYEIDLSTVFSNIDNIKPPQGALWDDVLAAVEQEQADGIEIPLINSNCSNINRLMDELLEDSETPSSISSVASALCSNKITVTDSGGSISVSPVLKKSSLSNINIGIKSANSTSTTTTITTTTTTTSNTTTGVNNIIAAATTVVSDHSYDKSPWSHLEHLGIQTPSDSEEEIDVVSLFERSRTASRSSSASSNSGSTALPTKPSAKDQEKIQVITTSKLLSASRAVSRRLKTKVTGRSKPFHHCGKRRISESEEFKTKINKKPRVYYKPAKSRFATDSESDSKEKRDMHNNMERMRRIDLRNSFEELRALVPSLANKERAPKVVILQDAAGYCTDLKIHSRQLTSQVTALRKEQERLRATVSGLRRSLAANR